MKKRELKSNGFFVFSKKYKRNDNLNKEKEGTLLDYTITPLFPSKEVMIDTLSRMKRTASR